MEYKNELLDGWVGKPVVVAMTKPPEISEERAKQMREDPAAGQKEASHSVRSSYELVGYDPVGITVRVIMEGAPQLFVPWSAVIQIQKGYVAHEDLIG